MRYKASQAGFGMVMVVLAALSTAAAMGQSTWQKLKQNVLTQQCKQGNQQACQALAKQKQGQQAPAGTTSPETQQPPVSGQTPPGTAGQADSAQQPANAGAWTPPAEGAPATIPQLSGPLDPSKLPDIQGVHPGMTIEQVTQVLARLAPGFKLIWNNQQMTLPGTSIPIGNMKESGYVQVPYDYVDLGGNDKAPRLQIMVEATKPPNPERIWHIGLIAQQQHIDRAVLLAALRKKYGKELAATDQHDQPVTNEGDIRNLWWTYDEQGRPQSAGVSMLNGTPNGCPVPEVLSMPYFNYSGEDPGRPPNPHGAGANPSCMLVVVHAEIPPRQNIIADYRMVLWDAPLSVREEKVTSAFLNTELQKARAASERNAKEAKPSL